SGLFMALPFGYGDSVTIGFEPRNSREKRRAEPLAGSLEECVDGATATQKKRLQLLVRLLRLFQAQLTSSDEVGRSCGILLLGSDRVGHARAGEFEIAKAFEKTGVAIREPGIDGFNRIDRFRWLIVPDAGRHEGKCELVHRRAPQRSEGRRA